MLPLDINLSECADDQLSGYMVNWHRAGYRDAAAMAAIEKAKRGTLLRSEQRYILWCKQAVDEALAPFLHRAIATPDNAKIDIATGGEQRKGNCWLDRYTRVHTPRLSAYFAAHVVSAGDPPAFKLKVTSERAEAEIFQLSELDEALKRWDEVCAAAGIATQ